MWDVSPYALYEYGALPSRHNLPRLLTYDIGLFYEYLPRAPCIRMLVRSSLACTLGTITWNLLALIAHY